VFKILKPASGKPQKSSHGRGAQNSHGGNGNLVFSQTGKLVSGEVKTDVGASVNAKQKFNKTHGHYDNQFLISNLKQTQNLSSSITNALLEDQAAESSALDRRAEHTRNKVM